MLKNYDDNNVVELTRHGKYQQFAPPSSLRSGADCVSLSAMLSLSSLNCGIFIRKELRAAKTHKCRGGEYNFVDLTDAIRFFFLHLFHFFLKKLNFIFLSA